MNLLRRASRADLISCDATYGAGCGHIFNSISNAVDCQNFQTGVVDSVNNGIPDLWQFDSGVSFATVDLLLYDCFVANYCQGTFYTIDA